VIGGDSESDEASGTRRLRPRGLRSPRLRSREPASNDFPVFLANSDRAPNETAPVFPHERKQQAWIVQSAANLAERFRTYSAETRDRARAFWRSSQEPGLRWTGSGVNEHAARIALALLTIPLVFIVMPGDRPTSIKPTEVQAVEPITAPMFDLDERLAFAQGLSNVLLTNAIRADFTFSDQQDAADPKAGRPEVRVEAPADPRAERQSPPADTTEMAIDDRRWRLPFDSQEYQSTELPQSPTVSFQEELPVSELLPEATPKVAELVTPAAEEPPPATVKSERRKRAVAQRRRAAPARQVATAASPPVVAQQQPNLPPPPILFFLGAPPPAPASVAPANVPAPQSPGPASSPPSSKPWLSDSLYDNVSKRY
jgi:hypothetical protein